MDYSDIRSYGTYALLWVYVATSWLRDDNVNFRFYISVLSLRFFPSKILTNQKFDAGASFTSFDFGVNFSLKGCLRHGLGTRLGLLLSPHKYTTLCHQCSSGSYSLMSRVFANSPGDLGSVPGWVIPKTQKMVLDATLLNTQHYKVRIKGKVEQSREWSSALPLQLGVVAIEKGAFESSSTKVANFIYNLEY